MILSTPSWRAASKTASASSVPRPLRCQSGRMIRRISPTVFQRQAFQTAAQQCSNALRLDLVRTSAVSPDRRRHVVRTQEVWCVGVDQAAQRRGAFGECHQPRAGCTAAPRAATCANNRRGEVYSCPVRPSALIATTPRFAAGSRWMSRSRRPEPLTITCLPAGWRCQG
jgi:hypothetical protein